MRISRRQLWVTCLAVGIIAPATVATGADAAPAASPASLTTTIRVDATATGAPVVRFTARNTSSTAVNVLSRDLPQARQSAPILVVTRGGTPVAYRGRLIKFAATTAADYTRIPARGTYTTTLDLAADYDMSQPGTYAVTLASTKVRIRKGAATAPQGTAEVKSDRGIIRTATGIRSSARTSGAAIAKTTTTVRTAAASVTITFQGCSSSRQTQLRQAVTDAATYSASATTWLAAHTSGGGLYKTWFGTYSSTRFNRVTSAFKSISSELTSKAITLDCTSTEDYYAYVYPDEPYTIYLCAVYWPAPAKGYDSKAGTLVHESSHFTVNGGSQDYVYGLEDGKALAVSSPAKAVANADNIEHFAESL
jgi:peptidyl-Lys metalloendopeptidase